MLHRIFAAVWLAFGVALAAMSFTTQANAGNRVALVIGNSAYKNTPALANPRHDAEAVAAALKRLGFDVVLALDIAQSQWAGPVREFAQRLRGADTALLFYAGHGLSYEGENYLVPVDAKAKDALDITFGMQKLRDITNEMARAARVSIVLLDACRDSPLTRGLSRSLGGTSRSTAVSRGLSRLEQVGQQSYIMFATKDGEVAADGSGAHSPFSQALLDNIETEGVEISELDRKIRKAVRAATGEQQVPLTFNSLTEAFYFHPRGDGAAAKAPDTARRDDQQDERRRDQVYWESVKDLQSIEILQSYIEKFPKGQFVRIAEAKIEQLKAKAKQPDDSASAPPVNDAEKAYSDAIADGSEERLRAFADTYPNHPRAAELKLTLAERDSWRKAEAEDTREAYERHLILFPRGIYAAAARERISTLVARAVPAPQPPAPPPSVEFHYVGPVFPPDPWLALRSEPSSRGGHRIMKMAQGTMFRVLDKKGPWYKVQLRDGTTGWAHSGWIKCCKYASP